MSINLAFSTTGLVISFIFFFSNQFLNWSSKLKKFSILVRKTAGILRIEKNKFLKIMLLLLKLFYIAIFSTLMFFIIVKKDLFTKKFYLFSQDNYFFISFFALCPVISISLFLFSRLFDKNFDILLSTEVRSNISERKTRFIHTISKFLIRSLIILFGPFYFRESC